MSDITGGGPARSAAAVVNDIAIRDGARALYVGVTGDITCRVQDDGADVVFKAVPVGFFPVRVSVVRASGTSATNIVALF